MPSNLSTELPEKFVRLMTEAHGAKGTNWLAALPEIIREIEEKWNIEVGQPFENLSYHFVASCVGKDGKESVLKIGFPEENLPIFNEAAMLQLYDGRGAVRFLGIDEKLLALLLEKLNPGHHLKDCFQNDAAKAVEIAVQVLQKIQRRTPAKHHFVHLENWFSGFKKAQNTSFPPPILNKAQTFYEQLSSAESLLLHGDFHHENILSATREDFLAIDPKGIVGQIGYEIAVFLNNHVWWLQNDTFQKEKLNFAISAFSQAFEIEPLILRQWAYAQAVLSAWWTFEENGKNWQADLAFAEVWEV